MKENLTQLGPKRGKIGQRKKKEKERQERRGVSRKNDASVKDFIETYQEGNSRLNSRPVSCAMSNTDDSPGSFPLIIFLLPLCFKVFSVLNAAPPVLACPLCLLMCYQFSSFAQSCLTLCDPVNRSTKTDV